MTDFMTSEILFAMVHGQLMPKQQMMTVLVSAISGVTTELWT